MDLSLSDLITAMHYTISQSQFLAKLAASISPAEFQDEIKLLQDKTTVLITKLDEFEQLNNEIADGIKDVAVRALGKGN